jgi:hypothetical protein
VVTLANCIELVNMAVKTHVSATTIEPTQEQVDRVNALVMQEVARQLEEDDDDAVVH